MDFLSRQRSGLRAHVPQNRSGTCRCRTVSASDDPDRTMETRAMNVRMISSRRRERSLPRMTGQVPARTTVLRVFPRIAFRGVRLKHLNATSPLLGSRFTAAFGVRTGRWFRYARSVLFAEQDIPAGRADPTFAGAPRHSRAWFGECHDRRARPHSAAHLDNRSAPDPDDGRHAGGEPKA